ncbi:MAG: PhzF family phenazine biosynthesis protein [Mycobacteriaceae bacterium]
MTTTITVVDAFTREPFRGNPAAVCLLVEPASEAWMQAVATELGLSETAFLVPRTKSEADLRWFTPAAEVDLCGHATLAAAHVLGADVVFHTRSGELRCTLGPDGAVGMDFPALPPTAAMAPEGLDEALGISGAAAAVSTHTSRFDLLVELADARTVRSLRPDIAALGALPHRGVIVTAAGDRPGIDCVSRFFGPAVGVDEDPVTGSAHCVLAPFWASQLGRDELRGEQASARGGEVGMVLRGDRVQLSGHAVTVWRGELAV